jgi:phage tail-like protein
MAQPLQASHRTLFGRFKFLVDINGFNSAAFQTASGLKFNIAPIEYWEGGALAAFKEPGRATFDDLVLERGVSYDRDFVTWIEEVIDILRDFPTGAGDISPQFKRDLRVKQLERDNSDVLIYDVRDGFPIEWTPGDLDNTADEVSVESLTITYRFFRRLDVGSPPA